MNVAIQIAEILGRVHLRHIVHKDLKPQNILLCGGSLRVELMDFGLSALRPFSDEPVSNVSAAAAAAEGTLLYMAPEQSGRVTTPIDHRADFYSLGVTFYHLLAGRLPFEGRTASELIAQHLERKETALIDLRSTRIPVCQALSDIVGKLMRKDAFGRYQSAAGIASDLRRCQDALYFIQQRANDALVVVANSSESIAAAAASGIDSNAAVAVSIDFTSPAIAEPDDVELPRDFAIASLGVDDRICILPQHTRVLHGRDSEVGLLREFFALASAYNVADTHDASNDDTRRTGIVGEESRLVAIEGEAGMVY